MIATGACMSSKYTTTLDVKRQISNVSENVCIKLQCMNAGQFHLLFDLRKVDDICVHLHCVTSSSYECQLLAKCLRSSGIC